MWRIEVKDKAGVFDAVGAGVRRDIADLGIGGVSSVGYRAVYTLEGVLSEEEARTVAAELLTDPVAQEFTLSCASLPRAFARGRGGDFRRHIVEIAYNPGVMDPVEESTLKGIRDLGIAGTIAVKTARQYRITGKLTARQLKTISEKLLYNKLIQHVVGVHDVSDSQKAHHEPRGFHPVSVDLLGASDRRLKQISRRGQLFLSLEEMKAIKRHFKKLKRNPTDCELETIAQTWSEHCSHKTFRGKIAYTQKMYDPADRGRKRKVKVSKKRINNLLKTTIMKVTDELRKPWCVSVFSDNSGVIRFDKENNICFKVETHNHPSALEPFGGANTGIGGVIRDPLGTGLGARPFLNTDVFCFGRPDYPFSRLPAGSLHPKRVMKGVVAGVRDYGNKMGIPTVNGAVLFHDDFVGNPLVYCGTAGILPRGMSFKKARTGDCIVVVGGRTGRDGIHGATFSSGELTHESESVSGGAVQIGNPIQEKKMCDAILQARDRGLYSAITDCGAGGLSSAVGEMGEALGAQVHLERVPLKYRGLSYTEIWISESQERMVLAVPPEKLDALTELFERENVEATAIGEFTGNRRLQLYYQHHPVCDLDMGFLHKGIPQGVRKAVYTARRHKEFSGPSPKDLTPALKALLGDYDICSKEWVIRQYDHEVQGGAVLKPLAGVQDDGPSDAAIVKPVLDSNRGVIVSNGINFRFGMIDPYWMAASCIDEALRQIVASGGSIKQTALLDNFCWGNPDKPDRLGSLVRAAYGCYDAAKAYGTPFISGKDSLNNEFSARGKSIAIPGTLLISAIAVMEDVKTAVSMYAKRAGDLVYAVGLTRPELGGSHYFGLSGILGNLIPRIYPKEALGVFSALSRASSRGLAAAMHDCAEGGIAVACAEMAFAGGLGMELFAAEIPFEGASRRSDFILFSESNSRFIVEVSPCRQKAFEALLKRAGVSFGLIGCLNATRDFTVYGDDGKPRIRADIDELKRAWREPLAW